MFGFLGFLQPSARYAGEEDLAMRRVLRRLGEEILEGKMSHLRVFVVQELQ